MRITTEVETFWSYLMRIFVTGATGFVGSAIVSELISNGHQVLGLTRSEVGAKALVAAGAEPLHGLIGDSDLLRRTASSADGVIHTAFNHDFSQFAKNCEEDRVAIGALGSALIGSDRPLLVTTGAALMTKQPKATETDLPYPPSDQLPRQSEPAAWALQEQGVSAGVVRLPPSTHGVGDHGFVPILIQLAREKGIAAYVGDGENHWPAVHRHDAARVYRLALERGANDGPYHAVAEEGVPFKAITEIIGQRLGVPVVSLSKEEAKAHFGWFALFASADIRTSSAHTRELLGWSPTQPGLLADIDQASYFEPA